MIMKNQASKRMKIPVEISARHAHLSKTDLEILFGPGFELSAYKDLSQPGQFAAKETVNLVSRLGRIDQVRVLGPVRAQTQIELSATDARQLGLNPPLRASGNLEGTPGLKIVGPKGQVDLARGVILAWRHLHLDPAAAAKLGVKNYDRVKVDIGGARALLFENVLVRVSQDFRPAMHIDTDEANAAGIDGENHEGEIVV